MDNLIHDLKDELKNEVSLNKSYEARIRKLERILADCEKTLKYREKDNETLNEENRILIEEKSNLKKQLNVAKRELREKDKQLKDGEEKLSRLEEDILRLKKRIRFITIEKEKMVRSNSTDHHEDIVGEAGSIKAELVSYVESQHNFRLDQQQEIEQKADQLAVLFRILLEKCNHFDTQLIQSHNNVRDLQQRLNLYRNQYGNADESLDQYEGYIEVLNDRIEYYHDHYDQEKRNNAILRMNKIFHAYDARRQKDARTNLQRDLNTTLRSLRRKRQKKRAYKNDSTRYRNELAMVEYWRDELEKHYKNCKEKSRDYKRLY